MLPTLHKPSPCPAALVLSSLRRIGNTNGGKYRKRRHSNCTIRNLLGTAGHGFGFQAPNCKELSACLFDFSGGKLPVRSDEVARITVRIALQIVLVLGLKIGRAHV